MSEPESTLPALPPSAPSRLRRFFLRHLPLAVGSMAALLALAVVGIYFCASSAAFENVVRQRLIASLETATGGRVEIASFHWHLLNLEADAGGLVIHGLESAGETPYARVDHLRVRLSILGFWSPRVLLRDLDVSHPGFHFIVYPNGSTNQPQPRKHRKPGKSGLDTFFNLQAGHVSVEQGILEYEDRAAAFDFQDRFAPLDFEANDASLLMSYVPATAGTPESYRIEAGVTDLNLSRSVPRNTAQPVHGKIQATLDLVRNAAYLRSLRLTAHGSEGKDRTLEISGVLQDFARPRWQTRAVGDLDMRLLDPVTGYPFAPEGMAHLDLAGAGQDGEFRADGSVHVDGGSYIGTGVVATGIRLDARVHADPKQLLITSIFARLRQGGEIDGTVALDHWLPPVPGAPTVQAASPSRNIADRNIPLARPVIPASEITLPVNGRVTADFKDVALDTLLGMVCDPPFQRLGLNTRINGPATAIWVKGDTRTLVVSSVLGLNAPGQAVPGEVPANGAVDGTYTQRNGGVDLRKLELHMPGSQLEARGELGAYPMSSPSALTVDFHTRNMGEFDTVLRDLGVRRNGRAGTAALPVALAGQADFHGAWTGSLVNPRLAGKMNASQLDVEMPSVAPVQNAKAGQPGQSRLIRLDSVEASGSYSDARIAIEHGQLSRGNTKVTFNGTLDAAPAREPVFDANSVLHLRMQAGKVGVDDLRPLSSQNLPVAGTLDARLQVDGPIHALGGSGWIELDGGSVYGEPVSRIRAQGTIANQLVKLTSVTVADAAGSLSGSGSYDLKSKRFQVDAKGAGIDVSRIDWVRRHGLAVTGKLGISVAGSGTLDDPRLEGHASLSTLALGGERLGGLELVARTANRSLTYDVTTRLEGAELAMHGQTALNGDHATQAKLQFSRFNIGALLKLAHVEALGGESSLAGTVTVEGPLAHPDQLRGEARLQEMAATVAGVHLKSEGGVHATLANGYVHLDPLHVTGENTDCRQRLRQHEAGRDDRSRPDRERNHHLPG
jgi:translocation and assembly module TamB